MQQSQAMSVDPHVRIRVHTLPAHHLSDVSTWPRPEVVGAAPFLPDLEGKLTCATRGSEDRF
jgi:hypothetical protein